MTINGADMTDREALEQLLERFGLAAVPLGHKLDGRGEARDIPSWVELHAGYGNVEGYSGFHATFMFDDDGSFQELHIWE
jgi:hypothetical protein